MKEALAASSQKAGGPDRRRPASPPEDAGGALQAKLKSVGAARPLARRRLEFASRADLDAALELARQTGCLRFSAAGRSLAGRIIHVAEELLAVEVDAAPDPDAGRGRATSGEPFEVAPIVSLFQKGTRNIKEGWRRLRARKK